MLDASLEFLIDRCIDATHEKARDRCDSFERFALGDAALEPANVRFHRSLVCVKREQQSDIDVDAFVNALLDCGNSRLGAGDFDHYVLAINKLPKAPRFFNRSRSVIRQQRIAFKTH